MKKLILFWAILMLFPTYGRTDILSQLKAHIQEGCPETHSYLFEELNLDYFYPQKMKTMEFLQKLLMAKTIPEYPSKFGECLDMTNSLCQRIKKIDDYRERIIREKKLIEMENRKIAEKDSIIQKKNDVIDLRNNIYEIYQNMIKRKQENYDGLIIDIDPPRDILVYIREYSTLEEWLEETDRVIQSNENILEENQKTREKNIEIERENEKIEKENAEIERKFQAYYTPERMLKLFNDYEKFFENLDEDDCKECPNREYVDGKCVLKKEILNQVQNDNKKKE